MRARWYRWVDLLQTGFWFVPMVMLALAFGLALLLLYVDHRVDPGIKDSIAWAYTGGPEGARTLLSTIAGSMITASTVTFSLAAVALSIASQQYGSRVLRNFMRDRTTQVLLGTFVSTFIYSVLVGRAIRDADASGGFVPAISVSVAIALVMAALVLLIYFIHHISASVQASQIIRVIVGDLERDIPRSYSSETSSNTTDDGELRQRGEMSFLSQQSGYLQTVDPDSIVSVATSADVMVELTIKPGDHVTVGRELARIRGTNQLDTNANGRLRKAFIVGRERTPGQDVRYLFLQLTEVVIRALSPGINDPFTAINGIDELESAIALLAKQTRMADRRSDKEGRLRLIVPKPTLCEILEQTVSHIAIYGASNPFVMAGLRRVLNAADRGCNDEEIKATVRKLADELDRREQAADCV